MTDEQPQIKKSIWKQPDGRPSTIALVLLNLMVMLWITFIFVIIGIFAGFDVDPNWQILLGSLFGTGILGRAGQMVFPHMMGYIAQRREGRTLQEARQRRQAAKQPQTQPPKPTPIKPDPKQKMGNPQPVSTNPQEKFIAERFMDANQIEKEYGIDKFFTLAMAACESNFGKSGIGNKKYNLWGIKAGKSWKGAKVLVTTTEYSKKENLVFPEIISKTWDAKRGMWKYRVKDWFSSYDSFDQAIHDWINNVLKNRNFLPAWSARGNARQYVVAIQNCKYKYATAPNYVGIIHNFIGMAENIVKKLNLK